MTRKQGLDLLERAAWTFAQAFVAVLLVSNEPTSKQALIAGAAAGISAVKSFVKTTLQDGAVESDVEHQFEHYLQGHIHPDIQPVVRREVKLGTVSMEGFLRLATDVFQANHDAMDDTLVHETAHFEYTLPDREDEALPPQALTRVDL